MKKSSVRNALSVSAILPPPTGCALVSPKQADELPFSSTSRFVRPHGLRPLWYLKSTHFVAGLEWRNVSQTIGR